MANKTTLQLWTEADRWLRHWQQVGGIGRPHDWEPLDFDPKNYPEMISRIGQVGGTFAGTEQHNAMVALVAMLQPAPAEVVEPKAEASQDSELEERLRKLALESGEDYEQLLRYATEFAEDGKLTEHDVARLEASWAKHVAAKASGDEKPGGPA